MKLKHGEIAEMALIMTIGRVPEPNLKSAVDFDYAIIFANLQNSDAK